MLCITCDTEMEHKTMNGVLVDHCTNCRSFWLDKDELQKLEEGDITPVIELRNQLEQEHNQEKIRSIYNHAVCQRCGHILGFRSVGDVTVVECPRCGGMFFDYEELDKVLCANRHDSWVEKLIHHIFPRFG